MLDIYILVTYTVIPLIILVPTWHHITIATLPAIFPVLHHDKLLKGRGSEMLSDMAGDHSAGKWHRSILNPACAASKVLETRTKVP